MRLFKAPGLTAITLALGILGCSEDSATGSDQPAAITEAAVVGTWTHTLTTTSGPIRIILDVKGDHSMVTTVKSPAHAQDTAFLVTVSSEVMTWSLEKETFTSTKTSCQYLDMASGALQAKDCNAPIEKKSSVSLSGKILSVLEGTVLYEFKKE